MPLTVVITVKILEVMCVVSDAWDEDRTGVLDSEVVVKLAGFEPLEVDPLGLVEDELPDGVLDGVLGLDVLVIVDVVQLPWEQTSVETVTVFRDSVAEVVVPTSVVSEPDVVVPMVELLTGVVTLDGALELPDGPEGALDDERAASEL